jgi:DNA-binding GntR family transcriptional regulator
LEYVGAQIFPKDQSDSSGRRSSSMADEVVKSNIRASVSLAEVAYARLKAAIQAHEFEPGQRMREAEIAEWLGISRTPTRDALRQLDSEGLLVAAPRRGLVVATLDHQRVTEIYDVRSVLESLAASRAARQATSAEIAILRRNLQRQEEADQADISLLLELNRLFHDAIYQAARNRYLLATLQALETPLALIRGTTYARPERRVEALEQHRQIVAAIESHDETLAAGLAVTHVRGAEQIRVMDLAESAATSGTD